MDEDDAAMGQHLRAFTIPSSSQNGYQIPKIRSYFFNSFNVNEFRWTDRFPSLFVGSYTPFYHVEIVIEVFSRSKVQPFNVLSKSKERKLVRTETLDLFNRNICWKSLSLSLEMTVVIFEWSCFVLIAFFLRFSSLLVAMPPEESDTWF